MLCGKLDAVRRYPVKSLRGERLECVEVDAAAFPAIARPRSSFEAGTLASERRTVRKSTIGCTCSSMKLRRSRPRRQRGVEAEVRRGEHFFDDAPISILVDRWLDAAERTRRIPRRVGAVPSEFFCARREVVRSITRAILSTRGCAWERRSLRVRCPIERCVAVTYHPGGKPSDPRILRYLAQRRNAWMGIYCDVLEPGTAASATIL